MTEEPMGRWMETTEIQTTHPVIDTRSGAYAWAKRQKLKSKKVRSRRKNWAGTSSVQVVVKFWVPYSLLPDAN